jgi:hypothetical protein
MRVELWAEPYGINLKCYWERLEENLGNLGNDLEAPKEHFENKEKKPKKIHYPPPPRPGPRLPKKTGPLMNACLAFSLAA